MPKTDSRPFFAGENAGIQILKRGDLAGGPYATARGRTKEIARDRAGKIAAALNDAVNHPWPDGGPSIQDVGDRPFLAYFEGDGWRELYHSKEDGEIYFADGSLVKTPPVVWRTMPAIPERKG